MNKEERNAYYRSYLHNKRQDPEYRKREYQKQRQWYARIKAEVLAMREERRKAMTTYTKHAAHARPVNQKSDLLTVREVAQLLRVDDTTVRRWVKQGALEAVILPHVNKRQSVRIKRETLDALLEGGIDE